MIKKTLALCLLMVVFMSGCGTKTTQNGPLKLTLWTTQGTDYVAPAKIDNDVVEKWIFDKTGVTIDNIYGNGGGQWESKLTQLIAGNNLPNLIHCGGGQGPAHFAKLASIDRIYEITDEMLNKYLPNVTKRISKESLDRIRVNGKLYGIPYLYPYSSDISSELNKELEERVTLTPNDRFSNNFHIMWIRDDVAKSIYPDVMDYDQAVELLKEKGHPIGDELMDIPILSTQDYIDFMYKIKDLNLKENGKKVYAFGYDGGDMWQAINYLGATMYGFSRHNYTATWNPKEEKITIPLLDPLVKQAALTQTKMVRDGVIDPESLMHTNAQFKEKMLNGQYAIVTLSNYGNVKEMFKQMADAGKTFKFRPFYVKVPAAEGFEPIKEPTLWGNSMGVLKTVKESDLPKVLSWINTMYSEEFNEVLAWGPKDAGLYEEVDGVRKFKDEKFQKQFVEGIPSGITPANSMGIGQGSTYRTTPFAASVYNPNFYGGIPAKYELIPGSGVKFTTSSPHVTSLIDAPPAQAWSPEYSHLEIAQKYWSSRSQWEDPFKLAFTAKSDEEFEKIWSSAVNNFNSIVDVESLTKQMTEVAKSLIKK